MTKTKEELNKIKEELVSFTTKLQELDDEELMDVVGGNVGFIINKKDINFDLIPAPESKPDIRRRIVINSLFPKVFSDTPTTSTFTDNDLDDNKNEYSLNINNESKLKDMFNKW